MPGPLVASAAQDPQSETIEVPDDGTPSRFCLKHAARSVEAAGALGPLGVTPYPIPMNLYSGFVVSRLMTHRGHH